MTSSTRRTEEVRHRILVAAADGNVWSVTLPSKLQPGVGVLTGELLLERSSSESDGGTVRWFCQLPGVQSIEHMPAGSGLTSLTLMRSIVTPSTLIVNTRGSTESMLQRHQSLELDEIEGEQSTCTLCLSSQEPTHSVLLARLFPDAVNLAGMAVILQGDLDGCVRFSIVHYPCEKGGIAKVSVIRSGALVRLDQPVQLIAPFTTYASPTLSSEDCNSEVTASLLAFDALVVLGTHGQIGIVDLRSPRHVETIPVPLKQLEIGCAAQSLVFVSNLELCIYCSGGRAFVCRVIDLIATGKDRCAHPKTIDSHVGFAEKLPLPPVPLLAMVSAVQPDIPSNKGNQRPMCKEEPLKEPRVRNLLNRIAQVSTEATALRTQSKKMDNQLKNLHSALEMLRLVQTAGKNDIERGLLLVLSVRVHSAGVEAIARCNVSASIVATGNLSDQQSITLDPDTFALQDQGALWLSSSLLFCPQQNDHSERILCKPKNVGPTQIENPLSFAIPLLQDRRILFAQLSQPIEDEISVSQIAIHAGFRQNHDPVMPLSRTGISDKGDSASSSALWSGVQWWAALTDHANKNPAFAAMLSKIVPQTAASLVLSPPSRFVMSIPAFFTTEIYEEDEDDDEDEDFEKLRFERMRALVLESINNWSEGANQRISASGQSEEVALDVSEVLEPIAALENILAVCCSVLNSSCVDGVVLIFCVYLCPSQDLKLKMVTQIEDPNSAICTDEVLQALSQLAQVEAQTLTLYWKTRMQLNRTIM
ncbi:unnamed protein product [Phytophthora fragariaefolia]|uniref:Unnamed protein product n=1 Tax=Phytophthora fragariaefolia TaxID=1490495 RepID=A0A9W6TMU0_9STRA|nr:unnamed protein product [Phytophthora fragariaefolia]